MTYSEILIKRITTLCEKRGLAFNKFAKMCGMNQSTIDNNCARDNQESENDHTP